MELSINPNTIQRAYTELERQGYIYSVKGKGSFIAAREQLIKERRSELMLRIDKLILEAKEIGISKDELMNRIISDYKEGIKND